MRALPLAQAGAAFPYTCDNVQTIQRINGIGGGVTDGFVGAAILDFYRVDAGVALRALKTVVLADDAVWALGGGVITNASSVATAFPVTTTIDQSVLAPDGVVVVQTGLPNATVVPPNATICYDGSTDASTVRWVWHRNRTIALPPAAIAAALGFTLVTCVSNEVATGSWAAITQGPNTTVSVPVFAMWLEHGVLTAANASRPSGYAYALLPNTTTVGDAAAAATAFWLGATMQVALPAMATCRPLPAAGTAATASLLHIVASLDAGATTLCGLCGQWNATLAVAGAAIVTVDPATATVTAALGNPVPERRPLTQAVRLAGLRIVSDPSNGCVVEANGDASIVAPLPGPAGSAGAGASVVVTCQLAG